MYRNLGTLVLWLHEIRRPLQIDCRNVQGAVVHFGRVSNRHCSSCYDGMGVKIGHGIKTLY